MLRSLCFSVSLAAAALGCGTSTYLVVEVESDLVIGTDVDRLGIVIETTAEPPETLFDDASFELNDTDHVFPLEIVLEPTTGATNDLIILVTAYLGQQVVAQQLIRTQVRSGRNNRIRVPPLVPAG